ncbi:MAG: hypothetical protein HC800_25835 [Phormidesmis sp. RL_2_1]|nr:hypothetical protein [Phormidesmis sp. RL_2_1]
MKSRVILGDIAEQRIMNKEQDRSDQGKFMQIYDEPLAKVPKGARFPISIDAILAKMPDKSAFIRDAVIAKLKSEGWLEK